MEKRCIDCEFCKLLDQNFCEWECACEKSTKFTMEVEMDDCCEAFSGRKDQKLRGTMKRSDLIRLVRDLGKANEKASSADEISEAYHDGYLDALSEIIREVYRP